MKPFYNSKNILLYNENTFDVLDLLIKQDKKFHEKYPLVSERIATLERDSHPPVAPGGATELKDEIAALLKRIEKLEKKK